MAPPSAFCLLALDFGGEIVTQGTPGLLPIYFRPSNWPSPHSCRSKHAGCYFGLVMTSTLPLLIVSPFSLCYSRSISSLTLGILTCAFCIALEKGVSSGLALGMQSGNRFSGLA